MTVAQWSSAIFASARFATWNISETVIGMIVRWIGAIQYVTRARPVLPQSCSANPSG